MEVHHHPKVESKKFKDYFLEFLMLFLAVTLGFFAENFREGRKDKRQVHEYMQSITNDLQTDLAMYDSSVKYNRQHCQMIDSIITGLNSKSTNHTNLYFTARKLTMGSSVISPTEKTFEQMKSGGILRLIGKQSIADSIASYYQWAKKFDYWSGLQQQRLNDVIDVNDRVFDANIFFSVIEKVHGVTGTTELPADPQLITSDRLATNGVIMKYQYYYGFLVLMNNRTFQAKEQANRLIELIKQEYRLN